MVIKVKNLKGTGSNAREITGTWLEYWEEQKGRKAEKCFAYDENLTKDRSKTDGPDRPSQYCVKRN
ncbi:MAG: hypothetical protein RBR50_03535 [Candidatus Izemoplasmatales bacterium]|nr:hypothetical protein [Candidatus Izemoplasmatales bacterium]